MSLVIEDSQPTFIQVEDSTFALIKSALEISRLHIKGSLRDHIAKREEFNNERIYDGIFNTLRGDLDLIENCQELIK